MARLGTSAVAMLLGQIRCGHVMTTCTPDLGLLRWLQPGLTTHFHIEPCHVHLHPSWAKESSSPLLAADSLRVTSFVTVSGADLHADPRKSPSTLVNSDPGDSATTRRLRE